MMAAPGRTSICRRSRTRFELHRRFPGSVVCDPEHLVTGLRRMLPEKKLCTDLRGVPLWRYGVRDVLGTVLPVAAGPVITPMTVGASVPGAVRIVRTSGAGDVVSVAGSGFLASARRVRRPSRA